MRLGIDLSNEEAIAELVRIYDMIIKEIVPSMRKKRWRQSEKIMAIASQMRRAAALEKAINKLKESGDVQVRSFPRRQ